MKHSTSQKQIRTITVRIPNKEPHDIVVGVDILGELKRRMTALHLARDVLIISSPTIFGLHGDRVVAALKAAGCREVRHELFPDGEEHKSVETWHRLLDVVGETEKDLGVRPLILNLGGGVVGDVGAFVAAVYGRGTDYIQLPTTLLGQVDCGIGGKCGVNGAGKNLYGTFFQPRLVLADLSFLKTLPARELKSGLAEVIKYGVILDARLFDYVEKNLEAILSCDLDVMNHIVNRCFELKVQIVEKDEKDEHGIRAKLNFGHTVGHALEAATRYKTYTHGEAISVGMMCACEIAEGMDLVDSKLTKRVEKLLQRAGLPTKMATNLERIMVCMDFDKKRVEGVNRFVLPTRLGSAKLVRDVPVGLIRRVVSGRISENKDVISVGA